MPFFKKIHRTNIEHRNPNLAELHRTAPKPTEIVFLSYFE